MLKLFSTVVKRLLVILGVTGLLSALSYYLYTEYRVVSGWQFQVRGAKILNISTDSLTVQVILKIINISSIEAVVSKLNANCYINGNFVGVLYQADEMDIPANGYNLLTLNVGIQKSSFFSELLNFTATGNPVTLLIDGSVSVKSGFLSVNVPFKETSTYTLADLIS